MRIAPTGCQDLAVLEQRRRVLTAARVETARIAPCPGSWIVQRWG